jgi:hypothetical protein
MDNKSKSEVLLSLCIPTNGVVEWVFPVLDSIYDEEVSTDLFEVVVTDNGTNKEFQDRIQLYAKHHNNLIYIRTEAKQFLNQVEAFKLANGQFIKFVNHRLKLIPGTLEYLVEFVRRNRKEKPCIYYMNGALKRIDTITVFDSFDGFVNGLSYFSSWSAGTGMWKSDFDKLDLSASFNPLFPHTYFIFGERNKNKYIIDNSKLFTELPVNNITKGNYDLFYAFSVEFPTILLQLVSTKSITWNTFFNIKKALQKFLALEYLDFIIMGKPCSYDLSSFEDSVNVFFSSDTIKKEARSLRIRREIGKIVKSLRK